MAAPFSYKRVLIGLWVALIPFLLVLWYYPVVTSYGRVAILAVAFVIVAGSVVFAWRIVALRWALIGVYLLIAIYFLVPSRPEPDRSRLRGLYSKALSSYEGCQYVWGGEGRFGIDCSGLVRRGLEDALMQYGFRTGNPYWIRTGFSLWWRDGTAQMMGEGYGGRTREVTTCEALNTLDHSMLLPGDLAVTASGIHVMVYLGNETWLGADPGEMRVTKFVIPEKNAYFSAPMKIVRWTLLDDRTKS